MADRPVLVYFVLGAAGSHRRAVLADLIAAGLPEGAKAAVFLVARDHDEAGDALLTKAGAELGTWTLVEKSVRLSLPENVTHLFIVADGRANPADQVEAFREWLPGRFVQLARVLCVLDAALASGRPELDLWFEACVHYADVVLVTKHETIDGKWPAAFEKKYRAQFYPFLFEIVRRGEVKNPALVLEPEARRLAQVFDEDVELADESDEEVAAAKAENDRFFVRKPGGARVNPLPDIAKFL